LSTRTSSVTPRPVWLVAAAGSTIGLCIVGDSLLYSILPLAAPELGISLAQVGVLLSVNRLVRLVTNSWAAAFFERWGPYHSFLIACVIGLISTALYGLSYGFALFLLARLLWGTAWSGLRQGGYQAVWTGDAASKGRLTGLLWGLVRLGSALGVLAGGLLYDTYGFGPTIAVMVGVTLLSVGVASTIRWPQHAPGLEQTTAPFNSCFPAW
jgi:predicted MFS family arabinose efflux permease